MCQIAKDCEVTLIHGTILRNESGFTSSEKFVDFQLQSSLLSKF